MAERKTIKGKNKTSSHLDVTSKEPSAAVSDAPMKRKYPSKHEGVKKPKKISTDVDELHRLIFQSDDDISHDSSLGSGTDDEEELIVEPDIIVQSPATSSGEEDNQVPESWTRQSTPSRGDRSLKVQPDSNTPYGFFTLIFTSGLMETVVTSMNTYAEKVLLESEGAHSRISRWKPVTLEEFKIFLALYFHTGIIKLSRLNDYWKTDYRFSIPFFTRFMSRNRYMVLLKTLSFCNNEGDHGSDRIFKIRSIFDFFNRRMDEIYSPGKQLSLDESMVLWRGRLNLRQDVKDKRHKQGVKLYVLAEPSGLVQRLVVHGGIRDERHADKVEGKSHSLFILAQALLDAKVDSTDTLQSNREGSPVPVTTLNRGDAISSYFKDICVTKWKDKWDVLCLSSTFTGDLVDSNKPKLIVEYNKHKKSVNRHDHLLSYCPSQKTLRWYKKLGLNVFQIMLHNSHLLYNAFSDSQLSTYEFRLSVIEALVGGPPESGLPAIPYHIHVPEPCPKDEKGRTVRRRCKYCWDTTKVRQNCLFYCTSCPSKPGLCLPQCFRKFHEYTN